LAERGFAGLPYDLANLLAPALVRSIHEDYFEAGADFVETNTFQAGRLRITDPKIDILELNVAGALLARSAAGAERLVLGAIGPCGKPIEPIGAISREEVKLAVREQAEGLQEGGVDGFILESYVDLAELTIAVEAIREVSNLPILASKAYIEDGEMLAEGLPGRCAKLMSELDLVAVGANCIVGPQRMLDLVRQLGESTDLPILAMPTPGMPQLVKGSVVYDTAPEYFAKATARLIDEGARIVGGCCGTTPEHIRQLRRALSGVRPRTKSRAVVSSLAAERPPLPAGEPSELSRKIGSRFVTAVEMDVPRGLNMDKLLAGARSLKIAGTDVINISDGARARLRMNPSAVSQIIQTRVGIEVVMHFSCRDRNLLAIQSDLLGAHALGLRNILAITGDPANIGDYPSATSVFDVDAIGLCRILARLNEGIDLAGYSVGVKCAFTIACAFNPMALDPTGEIDRLKRKAGSGAQVVYTQPIYDPADLERTVEVCGSLKLPVFIGVLPLRSARHTEFMHNEVPGIRIPDCLRRRIAEAQTDADALEIGVEDARSLAAQIKRSAQGIYLMPPFGNHTIAERVMAE
jgi:homocysteine S-methyltransferase